MTTRISHILSTGPLWNKIFSSREIFVKFEVEIFNNPFIVYTFCFIVNCYKLS